MQNESENGSHARTVTDLHVAHERSSKLELSAFEPLVGTRFTLIQTLDDRDARGVSARLTKAWAPHGQPHEDGTRQPFQLQFALPPETQFAQNTFLLNHPETGDFWAFLIPVASSEEAFTMATQFG